MSAWGALTLTLRSGQVTFVSGGIEGIEEGIFQVAPDEHVDAPTVAIFGGGRAGPAAARLDAGGEVGEDARAADPVVELTGDGEQSIADRLAFEPSASHPREEGVVGVLGQ